MKAKQYSFNSNPIRIAFFLLSFTFGFTSVNSQCPTVTNNTQSLCDVESVLVGDLQATDNGGGVVWYATATSSTPLSNTASLISGEDYYADDNTGACGTRPRVDITIYGPPVGNNFQGVCLDNPSLASVADLVAIGNDVQWYLSSSGGTPLNSNTVLIDDTIYYADQANPDTGCRTSRLSVFVNVGFTPIPSGDMFQEFCASPESIPTIADLVASGSNNWYISLFSALPLPDTTPLIDGQIYYGTTLDPPCESSGRLAVTVILSIGPDPGSNGTLNLCESDANPSVDLFTLLGGSPDTGGIWSPALNSGTGIYDPNLDAEGVYTYTVISTNSCPDDSSTVTVTLIPEPDAGIDSILDLCTPNDPIDLFTALSGSPESGGTWSPTLSSGTGIFNPNVDIAGNYTYTVSGTAPCVDASATVTVSLITFTDAGADGTIEICDNNGTINLFNSLEGTPDTGGVWSPILNSGTSIFDPLIDAQGIYTYSFTGNDPCPDTSASVTVTVNTSPNAGTSSTLDICSNDTVVVDLFNSLGGSPETGGLWSPSLTSGTGFFDPAIDAQGIYTYTINGISPCSNVSASVDVSIITEPNAGVDNAVNICSNNGTLNLFDTLNGTPDTGGIWTPPLNSGTGVFDPTLDADGTYTYNVTGTSPCPNATATVTLTVTPFVEAGQNGTLSICTDDAAVDLFDSLEGTPELGGTWSPALNSGTSIFDPNIDSGDTYTYTTSAGGLCDDDSATVVVTLDIAPDAGINGTLQICNTSNSVDLFNSLNGTPQPGGTWSPTLTSGTGIFDPNTDLEGLYTYTINSICGNVSTTVDVSIDESNDAGIDSSIELCTNDASIDLFNSLGGLPDTGGIWTPALNSGTGIFDPNIDFGGTYTYTVSNSATLCPDTSAIIIVTLLQEPNAGGDGTLNLCNASNSVDLFDSLTGTPDSGGTWSPALSSGTGIFDTSIDVEGIYTYIVNSTCGTSTATVTVSFTNLNDAGSNGALDICNNDTAVDLFNSLGGTPQTGGIWSPVLNSGTGVFDPNIDSEGTYSYTISNSASLCPSASASVTVTLLLAPDTGNDGTLNLCEATNSVDLFDSLTGTPDTGGTWAPVLTSGTGVFDPNTDTEGIYTYTINSICGNSSSTVTVSFITLNDAGSDGSIELCTNNDSIDLFNSLAGTPQTGGFWSPVLSSGTGIFDPSLDSGGIYTYTISSEASLCPAASASVTVTLLQVPNTGSDGTLNLCNASNSVDLFDSLAGNPDTGGIWSPALASGTSVLNPDTDPEGTYTYTINSICGNSSTTVTVSYTAQNDAGTNGTIELCSNDSIIDLFDSLEGTPQPGGFWSPSLNSGTGLFNPSIDSGGVYTYTIFSEGSLCPAASAVVTATLTISPDAGNDDSIDICSDNTDIIDLFDSLSGTPDTGGTWSPTLTSGTGVFDPTIDTEGIYTYTITNVTCGDSSATVTVSISELNDAGSDGAIEFCNNSTSVDLFDSLTGTPDTGGTWAPVLTSGTGVFDPTIDIAGTYIYTVSNPSSACPDATASVVVTILPLPNAGSDATLNLCVNEASAEDLFDSLGGTPDTGGAWSPALNSGTGVFDSTIDTPGIYTYSVNSVECGLTESASVTVVLNDVPDVTGLIMSIDESICLGSDAIVSITGANQLVDGDYTIVYQLTESNILINTVAITISGGNATFTIPENFLQNPGATIITLYQLFFLGQNCSADTELIEPIKVFVIDAPVPQLVINGNELCTEDNPTVADLTSNIIDPETIIWYHDAVGDTAYSNSELLEDGQIYYAGIQTENGCLSRIRLEVTVNLISCIGDLLIPDGFSPNGDGINDVFDILFINDLYPNFKLSIYNRYGSILYEGGKDSPKWDGTWKNNNTLLPVGVYFYILEFNDGEREPMQGRVYLSR